MAKTLEHLQVAEIQTETGYRYWTAPMDEAEMSRFLATQVGRLSDLCCSIKCPCAGME